MTEWDTRSVAPRLSSGARCRSVDPPGLYDIERAWAEKLAARGASAVPDEVALPRDALSAEAAVLLRHDTLGRLLGVTERRFPHVINRLAAAWFSPADMTALLDSMLFNERPERQGFPVKVVAELTQVRAHYETHVAPILQKVQARRRWEQARQGAFLDSQRRLRDQRIRQRREQAQRVSTGLRAFARRLLGKRSDESA